MAREATSAGRLTTIAIVTVIAGCSAPNSTVHDRALTEAGRTLRDAPGGGEASAGVGTGTPEGYVEAALAQSPRMRAAYERWRASYVAIDGADRIPDPVVAYSYFVRSVETRVGPQRHKVGVKQALPWPTGPEARANAALAEADGARARFEAEALTIRRDVVRAWWQLWAIRQQEAIEREQLTLLEALAESGRARLEVGGANLAAVSQLELAALRRLDMIETLSAAEVRAEASLAALVGEPARTGLPTKDPVTDRALPSLEPLVEAARSHPSVAAMEANATRFRRAGEAARSKGYPSLVLGVDWIETGDAADNVPDSGKDPIIATAAISLPVWFDDYASDVARAEAQGREADAMAMVEADRREMAVRRFHSAATDARRRMTLYDEVLIPQAETTWESVTSAYQVGDERIAAVLLAQRDLLELRVGRIEAVVLRHVALAELELASGRLVGEAP